MSEEARRKLLENYGITLDAEFDVTLKGKVWMFRDPGFKIPFVERRGIYVGELKPDGIRLNVYTASRLGRLARKNVIEIDMRTFCLLLKGKRVPHECSPGYYILKLGEDYVGCVRCNGKELIPFFPKEFAAMLKRLCDDGDDVLVGLRGQENSGDGFTNHASDRRLLHPSVLFVQLMKQHASETVFVLHGPPGCKINGIALRQSQRGRKAPYDPSHRKAKACDPRWKQMTEDHDVIY